MSGSGIHVSVRDESTGDLNEIEVPQDDYVMIATGDCTYTVQAYANGTHVITVKGRRTGITSTKRDIANAVRALPPQKPAPRRGWGNTDA